jgi:hypothetical protein
MLAFQGQTVRGVGYSLGLPDNDVVELALMGERIRHDHDVEIAYQRGRRNPLMPLTVVHHRRAA